MAEKPAETTPAKEPPISFGALLFLAVIGRLFFNYLHIPSVEPIIPIAVLAGYYYGSKNGFLVGATGYFATNILQLSLGPWTFFQALAGGISGYLGAGTQAENYVTTVVLATVLFEIIINFYGAGFIVSTDYYAGSLPFSITHIASNALFALFFKSIWLSEKKQDE